MITRTILNKRRMRNTDDDGKERKIRTPLVEKVYI